MFTISATNGSVAKIFLVSIMLLITSCGSESDNKTSIDNSPSKKPAISKTADSTSFEILFGGDTAFAKSYHDNYKRTGRVNILEEKGYEYTIKNLAPFLSRADHVILNLETPITHLEKSEFDGQKSYLHYEDPKVAPQLLKKYNVDAVSLANNHTLDFAEEGLAHTMQYLKEQGITLFGAGLNAEQAAEPYVKEFDINGSPFQIAVIGTFEYRKNYDEKYRFYATNDKAGSNTLTIDKINKQIATAKEKHPNAFLIIYPHWGKNYVWKNEEQTKLAHAMIDAGADLVLGHGAHKIQEVEKYKDKWIVYSLGNFLFNTLGRFEKLNAEPYSMVAMLKLKSQKSGYTAALNLYPIFSDNRISTFQPYFLAKDKADDFLKAMQSKSPAEKFKLEHDDTMEESRYYLSLPLL